MSELILNILTLIGGLALIAVVGAALIAFANWGFEYGKGCPPCNGDCNQGRECPGRQK